jgi:hypothetical protein
MTFVLEWRTRRGSRRGVLNLIYLAGEEKLLYEMTTGSHSLSPGAVQACHCVATRCRAGMAYPRQE